jgi:hypothetical protein
VPPVSVFDAGSRLVRELSDSVSPSTSIVPVLDTGTPTLAVPVPAVRRVPALLNAAVVAKKLPREFPAWRTNRLPGWLFQVPALVKSNPPLVAVVVAVPKLSTVRVSSMEKKPPLRVALPWLTVWPVPFSVPPLQAHWPVIVRVPGPLRVPPDWLKFDTLTLPATLRVFEPRSTLNARCASRARDPVHGGGLLLISPRSLRRLRAASPA